VPGMQQKMKQLHKLLAGPHRQELIQATFLDFTCAAQNTTRTIKQIQAAVARCLTIQQQASFTKRLTYLPQVLQHATHM